MPDSDDQVPTANGPAGDYNLLIATGQTPQVITETIFELKRTEDLQPAAVLVVTTRVGRAYGEAQLLGEERDDPARGTPVPGTEARWPTFCEDVLGHEADESSGLPVDLTFHVPEVGGRGLDDIRQKGDDTRFGSRTYELVEQLTREEALPLVGSIAGGRKTMSAHLMTAFSVYARPNDRLTHILLADPSLEGDHSFFYPETGSPGYSRLLDLVDVRFPRLRTLLEANLIDSLPEDRRDLEGILDALEPHVTSARTVSSVTLELRDHKGKVGHKARLVFTGPDGTLGTCPLTPKQASTLLAFAELRDYYDEPVPNTALIGRPAVEACRTAVQRLCAEEELNDWTGPNDVSKAVADLNDAVGAVPLAARLFQVEGTSRDPVLYDWPSETPPLQVAARHTGEDWPFRYVSSPRRLQT